VTLSEMTNGRYKITLDESWHHERPEVRNSHRVGFEQIPCRGKGHIRLFCEPHLPCPLWKAGCPWRLPDCRDHGDLILKLWTPRTRNARMIWEKIKGEGSSYFDPMEGEVDIFFPAKQVHLVAEMAGARRRRRLSPEARAKLVERGTAALELFRNRNVEGEKTAPI